jgi:hypothetical protein
VTNLKHKLARPGVLAVQSNYQKEYIVMEGNISKLTHEEIEQKIRELEHIYGELFGSNKSIVDLHGIHQRILELRQELNNRSNN